MARSVAWLLVGTSSPGKGCVGLSAASVFEGEDDFLAHQLQRPHGILLGQGLSQPTRMQRLPAYIGGSKSPRYLLMAINLRGKNG